MRAVGLRSASRHVVIGEDGVATVPLTRGKVALIDALDAERVGAHMWYAAQPGNSVSWYAWRGENKTLGCKKIALHRFILNLRDPLTQVDHINGDGLDNRRINLRLCSEQENRWNRPRQRNNTSGYIGVYLHRAYGPWWEAYAYRGKRRVHLGYYRTPEEAALAYDEFVTRERGPFARTNFPRVSV